MRILTLALSGLLSGTALHAAGDALVIGNSTYNGVQTLFGATEVAQAAQSLRDKGFDVTEARDAKGAAMTDGFRSFVSALEGDGGPVVVMLAGAFAHGANGTWLLPAADGSGLSDAAVMVEAFPIETTLNVLAQYPGEAVLLLAESQVAPELGEFLNPGVGALALPDGVTVVRGAEAAVAGFAASNLATVGQPLVAAAKAAGLTVEGAAPEGLVLVTTDDLPVAGAPGGVPEDDADGAEVAESATDAAPEATVETPAEEQVAEAPAPETVPEPAPTPEPTPVAEVVPEPAPEPEPKPEPVAEAAPEAASESPAPAPTETAEAAPEDTRSEVEIAADDAAWRAARIDNSEASYQAYLEAQPDGVYVNAASQRIKAIKADPFYELRRAEYFLGLDREARRDIQRDLDALGHYNWAVDGIFGDGTRDAVRSWQKDAGLDATGYLDLSQIARLDKEAGASKKKAEERQARAEAEAKRQREAAAAAARAAAEERRKKEAAAAAEAPARRSVPNDSAAWAEVERMGSEDAVRRYLRNHPNGERATQARQMLQVIEKMRRGG